MCKINLFLTMSKNITCAKSTYSFMQKAKNRSIQNHSRLIGNKRSILHTFVEILTKVRRQEQRQQQQQQQQRHS